MCIVDSDRASPAGDIGETASSVQQFKDTDLYPLIDVYETPGRDLENVLPDSFFRAYRGHVQFGQIAEVLETLSKQGETELRAHIDIEKGVTLRQIFKYAAGSSNETFWGVKLPILLACPEIAPDTLPCLESRVCSQGVGAACTCIIVRGNTSNILERFVEETANTTRYRLKELLDDSVRSEWLRLGSTVASWCCADDRLRL